MTGGVSVDVSMVAGSPYYATVAEGGREAGLHVSSTVWALLTELAVDVGAAGDLPGLRRVLARKLRWIVSFDRCVLAVGQAPQGYRLYDVTNPFSSSQDTEALPLEEGWPGWAIRENMPCWLPDLRTLPATLAAPSASQRGLSAAARSLLTMPLRAGGTVVGSLTFSSDASDAFGPPVWPQIVTLIAGQVGGQLASIQNLERATTALHALQQSHGVLREVAHNLSYQASHDALTGLINRREFQVRLERALTGAREQGKAHVLCLLDLDRFKEINDSFGHPAGDAALRELSDLLRRHVRDADTVARLGGDEFALIFESCPLSRAREIAEAIRAEIAGYRFTWEGTSSNIGVSMGLSPITARSGPVETVLEAADVALYAAKDNGRNAVEVYSAVHGAHEGLMIAGAWTRRLSRALDSGRLQLHYQPILSLADPAASGYYEALLRLRADDGALVTAGEFLPNADHGDLLARVDRWVVGEVCRTYNVARRTVGCGREVRLFVNLAETSLQDPQLPAYVAEQLATAAVPPGALCFEIASASSAYERSRVQHVLNEVRRLGCQCALANVGETMPVLADLRDLPVDYLKTSRGLAQGAQDDRLAHALLGALGALGAALRIPTIATCVETTLALPTLKALGVGYAQGYGVAPTTPFS